MCYSAMVEQKMRAFERWRKAHLSPEAMRLFQRRTIDPSVKIAKAFEANFYEPQTPAEAEIKRYIDEYHLQQTAKLEAELFKQKKRLADAERTLKENETKKALDDKRIGSSKVEWCLGKIADLKRTALIEEDSRIFPFWYAPVVAMEEGEYVVKPMRYHCRINGKPESYDKKYDGLYNARRNSLEKFWAPVFGRHHGIVMVSSFFENVAQHDYEKRELRSGEEERNLILHFNPQPVKEMLLACVWDHWQSPGRDDFYSFAIITDEPPQEVAATGHNRCPIPLKDSNVEAWLTPEGRTLAGLYALLDEREHPYFQHALAA